MLKKYMKEFFSDIHVLIMVVVLLMGLAFIVTEINKWSIWLALFLGMVTYTGAEYVNHRFVFHMKTPKNPLLLKFIKRIHFDHHVDPRNLKLLFLPVWYSLPQIIVISLIVYAIFGNSAFAIAYGCGIAAMLLYYEWAHYVAHQPINPKTPWGKQMKKMHLWHHFQNEDYWYGVTNPVYDKLLGTYADQKAVEKSKTARNLEKRV
ncbi:sterol desaturase family protein [Sporosarcina highlanderae]|uniref:Sterol desaturase family protein n=1 Tax=Sporosarcina highlanderae TaxID=3035916 RepID=A0ABT8JNL6_9BACL|nr:sterol desaturase family protein [Sporosarcina highlanderae]MDN4606743.1 sterol desaturase family protein [Sporosarcina highlanderae]